MTRSFEDAKEWAKRRDISTFPIKIHIYTYIWLLYEFIWHLQTLLPHFFRVYFQVFCYVMPLSEAGGYSGWWRVSAGFTPWAEPCITYPLGRVWWFQCPNLILKLVKEFRRSNVCVTLVRNLQFQYMLFWMQDVKSVTKRCRRANRECVKCSLYILMCIFVAWEMLCHELTTCQQQNWIQTTASVLPWKQPKKYSCKSFRSVLILMESINMPKHHQCGKADLARRLA